MTLKEWLALLILFLTYLLVGGVIFLQIESAEELKNRNKEHADRQRLQELLQIHMSENSWYEQELADKLNDYCGKPVLNMSEEEERPFKWNLYNSFYFAFTVVSSIGYGNLAPTCTLGRILCIFYALIGIPMNGILLATLGEFFSKTFLRAHHRYKEHHYESRISLITDIILYLIPGFILFIFLPAGIFVVFEGWPYDVAVYYAFVTLTTIGFGDYVAGQEVHKQFGAWFIVYQVLIVWWIVFGLGYLIMILGFITRAMRSKRMLDLEKRMAHKIKRTQSKLWRGMRDMGYLRRLLNEVYLLKFKPVYRDHDGFMVSGRERSRSLPSIRNNDRDLLNVSDGWDSERGDTTWGSGGRRRANSERVSTPGPTIQRIRSESDLGNIDKSATFAANNSIAPAELLAHVVEALSCAEEEEELEEMEEEIYGGRDVVELEEGRTGGGKGGWGFHGLSDDEILESEKHGRSRAASEAPIAEEDGDLKGGNPAEWTWYGTSASKRIHELMRLRQKTRGSSIFRRDSSPPPSTWKSFKRRGSRLSYRNSIGGKISDSEMSTPHSVMSPPPSSLTPLSHLWMLDPKLQKRLSTADGIGTGAQTFHRRTIAGNLKHTGSPALQRNRDSSISSEPEVISPVLEETSLADFLRALDSLHSRVGSPKAQEDGLAGKKTVDPSSCHSSLQWVSEKAGENNNILGSSAVNLGSPMPIFPTAMRRASLFNNRRIRRTSLSSTDSGSVVGNPRGQSKLRRGSLRS
ncbi:open rectifier potassium channel protein 1 [Hetaerina americana]|uniref:open rectifier potassium channel protein 1 n=1 Tax=Hetaerina americana TaxID=62018 RepID=UPI003A7F47FC